MMPLARLRRFGARLTQASRTLLAVPTIDRDAPLAARCFAGIGGLLGQGVDLMVLTRESDARAQAAWRRLSPRVILEIVPDYLIAERHNCDALAEKRDRARRFALQHGYDSLFFVDSDVEIRPQTYELLRACLLRGADVAFAPYAVRWYGNLPIVGIFDPDTGRFSIERVDDSGGVVCGKLAMGGLGCALLGRRALEVPIQSRSIRNPESRIPVKGEDIGFFLGCIERRLRVDYLRHVVRHHLEPAG